MQKEKSNSSGKKEKNDNDYLLDEVKQANDKLAKLHAENVKLKDIIKEHDLEEELEGIDSLSLEESICYNGLTQLAKMFEEGSWSRDEVQAYDILHKNYRMLKGMGEGSKKKKSPKADVGELFQIVKDIKEK